MKILCVLLVLICTGLQSFCQLNYREEFNGPFKSWANVKTRFKAKADGSADDTKALQMALDSLSTMDKVLFNDKTATRYVVVYLPAGTYKITATLRLVGKIGVTFIGEDPDKTVIKWEGGDNDTMFSCNRTSFMKISRITWDANNKKGIEILGLHYKDFTEPNFAPTSIEFSDMVFKGNPAYGISAGTYGSNGTGMMDAEVAIKRCKFINCLAAGISIKGFNALDYWIWDAQFDNCNIGVECNHGNYHIYQSFFNNSKVSDIVTTDATYTSVRNCISNNSKAFSIDLGASCNAFKRIFQGNTVTGCKSVPIQYHHQGKVTLLDNNFRNSSSVPFTVDNDSWCNGHYDMLSLGNNYSEAKLGNFRAGFPSKMHSMEDKKIDVKSLRLQASAVKSSVPFVPYVTRTIFEVPDGASSDNIQKLVNSAAALTGKRPIIHFPIGTYNIDKTIEVPANCDLQLIGDGLVFSSSFVNASKKQDFVFFKIKGPSFITVKDLSIGKDGNKDETIAFLFTNIDQQGAQTRIDQPFSKATNSVYIDKLNYTYFEKNNSFLSKGNTVIGGDKVKAGAGTSKLYCFGGQSAGVHLENNATMVARDCWWEGEFKKDFLPLNLSGNGNLTVDGVLYSPKDADSGTIIKVANFTGKLALLNMYISGGIDVTQSSPSLKMLAWNVNNTYKADPFLFLKGGTASKIAMMGFTTLCISTAAAKCPIEYPQPFPDAQVNIPDLNTFITEMTKDDREARPRPYINLAKGISNIYISRVSVFSGSSAFFFGQ